MKRSRIHYLALARPLGLLVRRSLGPLGALALAGCSWFGGADETAGVACPPALLLDGAERIVRQAPGQQRADRAVRYVAAISALEAECRPVGSNLEVDLRFVVAAETGPAYQGEPVVLDLFVAAVADDRLAGRHSLELRLEPDGGRARRLETLTIALAGQPALRRIYLGFALTPEELEERLRRRRR